MAKNSSLNDAKRVKNDEFYTKFTDIEQEVRYYLNWMKGKDLTIICNCDDPFESNFFKYFTLQFHNLGLKRLIGISYAGSPIAGKTMKEVYGDEFDIDTENHGYVVDVNKYVWTPTEGFDWDIAMQQIKDFPENKLLQLEGDGSFQSEESIRYLKQADLVVTNPPFSEFREFISLLMEYEKQFLIVGNPNAVTYKEVFPLIKENKLWLGVKPWSSEMYFSVPEWYREYLVNNKKEGSAYVKDRETNEVLGRVASLWFTNIDHDKRHKILGLSKSYYIDTELYPTYDNYDAIEVNKVKNIPWDYEKIMGVPITFLDKFNPEQFEILGSRRWAKSDEVIKAYKGTPEECIQCKKTLINGKETYDRIFIKNKLVDPTTDEWKRNYQNYKNRMKAEEITDENNA